MLIDGTQATVRDWSAALIAPAAYDLGFTSLLLANPPLIAPAAVRALLHAAGSALSRRFIRTYEHAAGAVDPTALRWNQALICLRALTEVAGWEADGTAPNRRGHPWMISRSQLNAQLAAHTGVTIAAAGR